MSIFLIMLLKDNMNRLLKLVVFSTSRSFLQNVVENPFQLQIPATIEELQGAVADQSEVSQKFS